MKGGKKNMKIMPKDQVGIATETTHYFMIFGIIDMNNGQQSSGAMECTLEEYESVKKQILAKEKVIIFNPLLQDKKGEPVRDDKDRVIEQDPMSINTEKYAYLTTRNEIRSAFVEEITRGTGVGLVDAAGKPIKT